MNVGSSTQFETVGLGDLEGLEDGAAETEGTFDGAGDKVGPVGQLSHVLGHESLTYPPGFSFGQRVSCLRFAVNAVPNDNHAQFLIPRHALNVYLGLSSQS